MRDSHSRTREPRDAGRARVGSAHTCRTDAWAGFTALAGRNFETRLPPHVHSTYVLGVIDRGTLSITQQGRSFLARPGDVLAIAPFTVHTELPVSEHGWSFRYLYPAEVSVRAALSLPQNNNDTALPFAAPVIPDHRLAHAIARAHDLIQSGTNSGRIEDALLSVFRQAREHHCVHTQARGPRANILGVRSMLTQAPVRNITLADMASLAGLSVFRFARVFHQEIGLPPYEFYQHVRIAFAHQLIQEGHELSALAYRLGYADQSHMTRHFCRASFTTPGRLAAMAKAASAR